MPKRDEYDRDEELITAEEDTLELLSDDLLEDDGAPDDLAEVPFLTTIARANGTHRQAGPSAERESFSLDAGWENGGPDDLPGLFARGKQQGFVTADEILQVQPEPEMHLEEVDELYAELLD